MSVEWLFLVPVPRSVLSTDAYLDVDDRWKGEDYVIESGDRWDRRVERSPKRRRDMAVDLTRAHLAALRRSKRPRDILVTTDAAVPNAQPPTYVEIRKIWMESGAFALPDVVDEVVASMQATRSVPPLNPADVRIPFPEGTIRARLRRLDPTFAFEQLGRKHVSPEAVAGVRAGVVLVDVSSAALPALAKHYRKALRALGMKPREDKPSKWVDATFVQMRGRAGPIEVSITAQPKGDTAHVSVLWIERVDLAAPQ